MVEAVSRKFEDVLAAHVAASALEATLLDAPKDALAVAAVEALSACHAAMEGAGEADRLALIFEAARFYAVCAHRDRRAFEELGHAFDGEDLFNWLIGENEAHEVLMFARSLEDTHPIATSLDSYLKNVAGKGEGTRGMVYKVRGGDAASNDYWAVCKVNRNAVLLRQAIALEARDLESYLLLNDIFGEGWGVLFDMVRDLSNSKQLDLALGLASQAFLRTRNQDVLHLWKETAKAAGDIPQQHACAWIEVTQFYETEKIPVLLSLADERLVKLRLQRYLASEGPSASTVSTLLALNEGRQAESVLRLIQDGEEYGRIAYLNRKHGIANQFEQARCNVAAVLVLRMVVEEGLGRFYGPEKVAGLVAAMERSERILSNTNNIDDAPSHPLLARDWLNDLRARTKKRRAFWTAWDAR